MKKRLFLTFSILLTVVLIACSPTRNNNVTRPPLMPALDTTAPYAEKIPFEAEYHGLTLSDPWHWLKDQDYPKTDDQPVLDYLKAENAYFDAFKQQHTPLIERLFEEFKGRVDESETSVPSISNGYVYRWEYKAGDEYKTWYRKPVDGDHEVVFINEPELAKQHEYFVLGDFSVSPNNRYLAYTVDTSGDERYDIYIKDLNTGEMLEDLIQDAGGSVAFSADSLTLLYDKLEPEKWRTESINAHKLGDNLQNDKVIITEKDDAFFLSFSKTRDGEYFIFRSGKAEVQESHVLNADLSGKPILLASRDKQFSYSVDHAHDTFYILANDTHVNFRIATVSDQNPEYKHWQTLVAGSDQNYIRDIDAFDSFLAVRKNINGLEQLELRDYQGNSTRIEFPESLYTVRLGANPDFIQPHLRVSYQSMITPSTVFDYDLSSKQLIKRKEKKIPSGYDKNQYETARLMAEARDGAMVPISIMYKKGTKLDGSNPLHLYGYGAYGAGMSPRFSSTRLSLVDRGVIYAIAHIRGGDEMGYQWYLDGKLEKRTNTFNDFVDVARYLVAEQYTSNGNISISGRSAGGELMGAAIIQAPELWSSVILGVPFVDVLNTMLDASLPLTPPEWSEWGNPIANKEDFKLIQSYSPYDNITARDYPPMLVTGGLNDPRVTYWEPAKWTAKMRDMKTDNNLLIMRINMGAGHFANSGRYGRLKDYAEEHAFTLLSHGINE